MNKTIYLSIIIAVLLAISFVGGQTAQQTPTPQPTPTPAQLEGYITVEISTTNHFTVTKLGSVVDVMQNFVIVQNNNPSNSIGSFGFNLAALDTSKLVEGDNALKIKKEDVEIGEISMHYSSTSQYLTIKNLRLTTNINANSVLVTNQLIDLSANLILAKNDEQIALFTPRVWFNTLAELSDDNLLTAEIGRAPTSQNPNPYEKLGEVDLDASHIQLSTVQMVENDFTGKITSTAGNPVIVGNVCVSVDNMENCARIQKLSDGSGRYGLIVRGKDKTSVTFKVNGIEVGTKQLDATVRQVTFDLQVDTSNVNFADDDRDGIPNAVDRCQDSVVQDVDINGCDCSQKQCGVGSKCEPDLSEGNKCVDAPVKRCSQASSCVQRTVAGQIQNDAPKYCNNYNTIINNCQQCGCPADFTCAQNGDCIKVLTGLVGSVCKDNDFMYSLSNVACPDGWIIEDITRYLSVDVDGPPLLEDIAQDEVDDKLKEITLCLKTSDLGCAPKENPYKCRFEDLLEKNRDKAARILENEIRSHTPTPSWSDAPTETRIGVGFLTGGLFEILDLAGLMDFDLEPSVDLSGFTLRSQYDCPPKLVTSDVECTPLINNGPSDKRVDLVFVGDGFLDDKSFIDTVKEMIDYESVNADTNKEGLFSIEPFKSAKTKFNIWTVNAKDKIKYAPLAQTINPGRDVPSDEGVNAFASYCANKDRVIVVSTQSYRSFCFFGGKVPCFVSVGNYGSYDAYKGRLLLHEFGHGFASLEDEYANEAPELKNAPNRIEDLVTGVRTDAANCKATQEEAQTAWGSLISPENKLGFFKGCGGDCMPYCKDAVRPTYLSIMNAHFLNIESELMPRDATGILSASVKKGAPFHPYYNVNELEIKKELDKYEAGDPSKTVFYGGEIEKETQITPEHPASTPTPTEPPTTQTQPTSGTIRNQVIKDCTLNTLCDVPQTPVEYIYVNVDNINELPNLDLDVDGKASFAVNTQYGTGINFNLQSQNAKLAIVQKAFSAVLFADCQTALASSTLSWTHELTDNKATVCLKGDKGTIMKLGNTKIVKSTKSTKQTTPANCGQQGQPVCDVLNQIVFDYSIDYEILTEQTTQPQSPTNPTCIDSDNGKNYYFKGLAERTADNVLGPLKVEDSCVNSDLQEVTCPDPYGNTLSSTFTCQNGCADGACIPLPAESSMSLSTDKSSYALNEKVTVISQLPSSMDAMYYFVSSAERRWVGSGGSCPAAGSCFGYNQLPAGNWQAEIIAWQHNTPETAYKINSAQFTVQ